MTAWSGPSRDRGRARRKSRERRSLARGAGGARSPPWPSAGLLATQFTIHEGARPKMPLWLSER